MTPELLNLARITVFTSVLWIPYVLDRVRSGPGARWEMGYPEQLTVLSPWAQRLRLAHQNAIENLAVFAPLVLIAHALGVSTPATVAASAVFLWARIVHATSYTFKIPVVRTLSFCVGWGSQVVFGWALLH